MNFIQLFNKMNNVELHPVMANGYYAGVFSTLLYTNNDGEKSCSFAIELNKTTNVIKCFAVFDNFELPASKAMLLLRINSFLTGCNFAITQNGTIMLCAEIETTKQFFSNPHIVVSLATGAFCQVKKCADFAFPLIKGCDNSMSDETLTNELYKIVAKLRAKMTDKIDANFTGKEGAEEVQAMLKNLGVTLQ